MLALADSASRRAARPASLCEDGALGVARSARNRQRCTLQGEIPFDETEVRAGDTLLPTRLYRCEHSGGVTLVLGPGAGAPQSHPFMVTVASAMAAAGVHVRTFDFPYAAAGRRVPDRMPTLRQAFEAVFDDTEQKVGGVMFVGGKSMGSRVAAELCRARLSAGIRGLVCYGYPLAPPTAAGAAQATRREALLHAVSVPMCFVHGTRDPFATAERMAELVGALGLRATLHVVTGGDHSLELTKSALAGRPREAIWRELAARAAAWVLEQAAAESG